MRRFSCALAAPERRLAGSTAAEDTISGQLALLAEAVFGRIDDFVSKELHVKIPNP